MRYTRILMSGIRRLVFAAALVIAAVAAVAPSAHGAGPKADMQFENEVLNYKVMFKWGLINKVAGRARVELTQTSDFYRAAVYARSEPWADRIYSIRDTLSTEMHRGSLAPVHYRRVAHEDGKHVTDDLKIVQVDNKFSAECVRTRYGKKGGDPVITTTLLEAEGMTVDFLSAFYYLRSLDFDGMLPGYSVTINILSGKRKELLRFTFRGIENIELKGSKNRQQAYKVSFTFTSDGKKETSDPITAWIAMDKARTPLQIEGKLKVGKIRCVLDR